MGARGPARKRDDERLDARPRERPSKVLKPEHAKDLPFEVEFNPVPPELLGPVEATEPDGGGWHPLAARLYEALKVDPARVWMGPAAWAEAQIICETLSRELGPQVIGWTEEVETFGDRTDGHRIVSRDPIIGRKPVSAGTLNALMKWAATVGINEGDRLRLNQEVTFGTVPPSIGETEAPNLTLVREEALSG